MNIALIIGVSTYSHSNNNLPGCKNDADAIYQILKKSEKYDDILVINNNENSAKTKELLSNFFLKHKGTVVNELFFTTLVMESFRMKNFFTYYPIMITKRKIKLLCRILKSTN